MVTLSFSNVFMVQRDGPSSHGSRSRSDDEMRIFIVVKKPYDPL
jgi:hypothetical protein